MQSKPTTPQSKVTADKLRTHAASMTCSEIAKATGIPRSTKPRSKPAQPPQIVMPPHVQITHIAFCPPSTARICNGTSREVYRPHASTTAVGAGTAYGRLLATQHAARQ